MKKILIIGGSYFLGRVFVEELLDREDTAVTVLNRGKLPLKKTGVEEIICDRHDREKLREILTSGSWDTVVDFCAYTPEDFEGMFHSGPPGNAAQYIFISTASVYEKTHALPVNEDAPKLTGPQPELGPFSDYAYNKWKAEEKLMELCGETGTSWTILRPAFIYGKFNYAPRENYFFDLIVQEKPLIVPENAPFLFSFVSVWDAAKLTAACIGNKAVYNAPFNIAAEELVSYPLLIEVFREITGIPFHVESRNVDRIIEENIPLPFPLDEHLVYDGSLIADIFGFQYTAFLDGMRETYRFYRIGRGLS